MSGSFRYIFLYSLTDTQDERSQAAKIIRNAFFLIFPRYSIFLCCSSDCNYVFYLPDGIPTFSIPDGVKVVFGYFILILSDT